jgi:hypothetical protein
VNLKIVFQSEFTSARTDIYFFLNVAKFDIAKMITIHTFIVATRFLSIPPKI